MTYHSAKKLQEMVCIMLCFFAIGIIVLSIQVSSVLFVIIKQFLKTTIPLPLPLSGPV